MVLLTRVFITPLYFLPQVDICKQKSRIDDNLSLTSHPDVLLKPTLIYEKEESPKALLLLSCRLRCSILQALEQRLRISAERIRCNQVKHNLVTFQADLLVECDVAR